MSFTFFFSSSADHPDLHSFPTRRSSDLPSGLRQRKNYSCEPPSPFRLIGPGCDWSFRRARRGCRQYEIGRDTSELQSPMYLVCRLLLEKKKIEIMKVQHVRHLDSSSSPG